MHVGLSEAIAGNPYSVSRPQPPAGRPIQPYADAWRDRANTDQAGGAGPCTQFKQLTGLLVRPPCAGRAKTTVSAPIASSNQRLRIPQALGMVFANCSAR